MKEFNIPQIKAGEYIFELMNEMAIGYLIYYVAPFTGGSQYFVPAGFKFTLTQSMREDAFYISPIDNDKNEEERLFAKMLEKSKNLDPKYANRITGFSFFITEEQLRTSQLKLLKGEIDIIFEIIKKQKEEKEYYKNYNPFEDAEWVEKNYGSTYKKLVECGKPKVLKAETETCPFCGYKLRPVFWGEITSGILQQKKERKIFIGEDLYGKTDDVQPEFACGNCGESFVRE
jgi:hypothetical protein